jgi:hypothetical protein
VWRPDRPGGGGSGEGGALIEEVVQGIGSEGDVEGAARLGDEEGIEANSPRPVVAGREKGDVTEDEGGAAIEAYHSEKN